jgi:hypothetical protein
MNTIEVLPGIGVGPLKLGKSRAFNRIKAFKGPESFRNIPGGDGHHDDQYFGGALRAFYDDIKGECSAIKVRQIDSVQVLLCGLNVFDMPCADLVAGLKESLGSSVRFPEEVDPVCWHYPDSDLTLYATADAVAQGGPIESLSVTRQGVYRSRGLE